MKYIYVVLTVMAGYILPALIEFPPVPKYYFVTIVVSLLIASAVLEIQLTWLTISIAMIELLCMFVAMWGWAEYAKLVPGRYVLYYIEDMLQAAFTAELILLAVGVPWSNVMATYNRLVSTRTKHVVAYTARDTHCECVKNKNNELA